MAYNRDLTVVLLQLVYIPKPNMSSWIFRLPILLPYQITGNSTLCSTDCIALQPKMSILRITGPFVRGIHRYHHGIVRNLTPTWLRCEGRTTCHVSWGSHNEAIWTCHVLACSQSVILHYVTTPVSMSHVNVINQTTISTPYFAFRVNLVQIASARFLSIFGENQFQSYFNSWYLSLKNPNKIFFCTNIIFVHINLSIGKNT